MDGFWTIAGIGIVVAAIWFVIHRLSVKREEAQRERYRREEAIHKATLQRRLAERVQGVSPSPLRASYGSPSSSRSRPSSSSRSSSSSSSSSRSNSDSYVDTSWISSASYDSGSSSSYSSSSCDSSSSGGDSGGGGGGGCD